MAYILQNCPFMNFSEINAVLDSAYTIDQYPTLSHQINSWQQNRPLQGLRLIDATPLFRNTLLKHRALTAAGAEVIIGLSDGGLYDPKIVEMVTRAGIQVVRPDQSPIEVDLILDCAAIFSHWTPRIGFSELTRSGTEKFTNCTKPVFVADNGRIKRIETCLGTGESFFRAMAQLGYTDWQDKRVVIFGSGKVGTGLILYALRRGAQVTVITDPVTAPTDVTVIDYRNTAQVAQAVESAYAVVTATGRLNALQNSCSPEVFINSGALLANMGVEDEFGSMIPADRVLMAKKPINFILEEPTHLKYIETTMALHNQGALHIVQNHLPNGIIEPPVQMEHELLELCRQHGCIADELTLLE